MYKKVCKLSRSQSRKHPSYTHMYTQKSTSFLDEHTPYTHTHTQTHWHQNCTVTFQHAGHASLYINMSQTATHTLTSLDCFPEKFIFLMATISLVNWFLAWKKKKFCRTRVKAYGILLRVLSQSRDRPFNCWWGYRIRGVAHGWGNGAHMRAVTVQATRGYLKYVWINCVVKLQTRNDRGHLTELRSTGP